MQVDASSLYNFESRCCTVSSVSKLVRAVIKIASKHICCGIYGQFLTYYTDAVITSLPDTISHGKYQGG